MPAWYALHVKHQCEPIVEAALAGVVETFWPHRTTKAHNRHVYRRPWFPGYVFVRVDWTNAQQSHRVYTAPHSLGVLRNDGLPLAIPDQDIESLKVLMAARAGVSQHPLVRTGIRVRVASGPLKGIEGVVQRYSGGGEYLVVQIEICGRGVATHLDGAICEAILESPRSNAA